MEITGSDTVATNTTEEKPLIESATGTGTQHYKNKLKKRKKKFLANAKGFGKTGNFGRGSRLEGDEWSYFINIMDAIRLGFDSLDDKRKFIATSVHTHTIRFDVSVHFSIRSFNGLQCF